MQFSNPIVRQLIVYGSDGLPDVKIGLGPSIELYNGLNLIIEITATGGAGIPTITVQNTTGDALELSLFSGIPAIRYTFAGNSGHGQIYFTEWTTNRNALILSTSGELGDLIQMWLREDSSGNGFGEIAVNQEIVAIDPATSDTSESWHNVSYQNSWSNFGSGYSNGQYRLMPDGTVRLRGVPTAGTKTNGTVVFTLPTGYRPPATKQYKVPSGDVTNVRIEIESDGEVRVYGMGVNNAIVLDGITFELSVI